MTDKQGATKYFNSLEAWKLEGVSNGNSNDNGSFAAAGASYNNAPQEDDLPF